MANRTVAVIQARMGSSRLPGKVMLPLAGTFELQHVIQRASAATAIDEVIVATPHHQRDDILEWCVSMTTATSFRGSEEDVLGRMSNAAGSSDAEHIVRITADCPLIEPNAVSAVVRRLRDTGADYASNIIERTFPRGLDVEAFTAESFERVHEKATQPHQREHATAYYHDHVDEFQLENVRSSEVFDDPQLQDRTDLRLTLDVPDDYRLLYNIFENVSYEKTPSFPDVVRYVDETGVNEMNANVAQKSH